MRSWVAITWAGLLCLSGCALEVPPDGRAGTEDVGESEAELGKNALSRPQEQTALKLIDDICGDTWCSGDYDFAFRHLTCRGAADHGRGAGTCTLSMHVIPREGVVANRPYYARHCTTPAFTDFASLVVTAPNGYQSLQPDYYSALTDCVARIESQLPR